MFTVYVYFDYFHYFMYGLKHVFLPIECAYGVKCTNTIQSHYRKYRHSQLADVRAQAYPSHNSGMYIENKYIQIAGLLQSSLTCLSRRCT